MGNPIFANVHQNNKNTRELRNNLCIHECIERLTRKLCEAEEEETVQIEDNKNGNYSLNEVIVRKLITPFA